MPSPLNISLKVTGLDQAKADLQQLAQSGKRSFDELAAEAKKLSDTSAATDQALRGVANRVRQMAAELDPAGAATIRLRNSLTDVDRALKAGIVSTQQASTLTANLRREHEQLARSFAPITTGMVTATASAGQMRASLVNLGQQAQDVAVSLQAGQAPMTVLLQQGSQIATVFAATPGGVSGVLSAAATAIRGLITPTTLAVVGLGALGAGMAVLALRSNTSTEAIRQFNVVLQGMNVQSLASAEGLEAAAKGLLDVGVNAAEARKQITDIARAGLNPIAAPQIVRTGANLSAYLGGDQTQALTQALAGGVDAAAKYAVQVGALTGAQAALRQEMARTTPGAKVLDEILQQIATHAEGAYQRGLSPLGKAINDTRVAWDKFIESLTKSGEVEGFLKGIKDTLNEIEHILRVIAELKAFITGDKVQSFVTGAPSVRATAPALGAATGGGGSGIVAEAQTMLGMNETRDRSAIAAYLSSGGASLDPATVAWCAAFANAVLAHQGMTGTTGPDRMMASSFLNWGTGVSGDVAAGDVIVLPNRSRLGTVGSGHVGFATGNTSLTDRGLMLEMISGNRHHAVTQDWVNANEAVLRRSADAAAGGVGVAGAGTAASGGVGVAGAGTAASEEAIRQARKYADEQQRAAEATRNLGLENAKARIEAEVAGRTDLDAAEKNLLTTKLLAAEKTKLTNEIVNEATATNQAVDGANQIANAYQISAVNGKAQEIVVKAQAEALLKFGNTSSDVAKQYINDRTKQATALEQFNEAQRNAQDMLAGQDTQAQLQAQIALVGQLPEIAQRELTLLQAKQTISRDFPLLTEQEKNNRLAMVQATADLNVKLAETQRAQQRMDSIFSDIGNTISNSIGSVIDSIFNPSKAMDWGKQMMSIVRSIGSSLIQSLLVKPLTGDLLGVLGASANVTNQFGSLTGGGGLGSLLGGGLLKDLFGGGSSSGGGMFSGVSNFFNNTIGGPLGFAPSGLAAGTGAGSGIFTNLATGATSDVLGSGVASGMFGGTTFGGFLGGAGLGFGAGSLLNSLMGGNKIFGTAGSGLGSLAGAAIGSIIPGIGTLIGGLLGGAGGGLLGGMFGNSKPSNQSAGANFDLSNFKLTAGFAGGNQQIDQATQQVAQGLQSFLALLQTTGGALSGNVLLQNGVNTGFTADSSLPQYSGRFNLGKDPTAALQTIELALSRSLTGISDTMRTVLDQISDPAELQGAIAFANAYDKLSEAAEDAFKSVENGKNEMGPFATAMQQIDALFQGLTEQANRFGLALDPINAALAEATSRLQGDFLAALNTSVNDATGAGFINQLQAVYDSTIKTIQESQALGLGEDPATQDLIRQAYEAQLSSILSGLDDAQLNETIAHFTGLNDAIAILAQSALSATDASTDLAADLAALTAQAAQAFEQIQDFLDQLNATPSAFVSPESALAAAQSQFAAELLKAQTGDVDALSGITGYADQLIKAIESYYASGPTGQSMVDEIKRQLEALIGITATPSVDPVIITNQLLTDVVSTVSTGTGQTVTTITSGTQQLIDANNAVAAATIAQFTADNNTLIGVTNATAAANIAMNQEASAALIAANNQGAAEIVAQNDVASAALIAANDQGAADIVAQNDASATALIAANDNATAQLIADGNASTAAILAGASADATAIGLVVQSVGDQISEVLSSVLANSGVQATYDAANSIIHADNIFADNTVAAIYGAANSVVNAGALYSNSEVAAIYGAANSLINVGATYTNAITSAIYGSAGGIVSAEAAYGNSALIAVSTASASNDNLLNQANGWLNIINSTTDYYGQVAVNQRQDMVNKLQQILDQLRLQSAA